MSNHMAFKDVGVFSVKCQVTALYKTVNVVFMIITEMSKQSFVDVTEYDRCFRLITAVHLKCTCACCWESFSTCLLDMNHVSESQKAVAHPSTCSVLVHLRFIWKSSVPETSVQIKVSFIGTLYIPLVETLVPLSLVNHGLISSIHERYITVQSGGESAPLCVIH